MEHEEWLDGALLGVLTSEQSWGDLTARFAAAWKADGVDLLLWRDDALQIDASGQPSFGASALGDEALREYLAEHARRDPLRAAACRAPLGRPWTEESLLGGRTWRGSGTYRRWAGPRGVDHVLGVCLEPRFDERVSVTFWRSGAAGPFGRDDRARLAQLAPNLQRTLRAALRGRDAARLRDLAIAALDVLSDAVLALAADGRVLFANAAGDRLLCAGRLPRRIVADAPPDGERAWVIRPIPPNLRGTGATALAFVATEDASLPHPRWMADRYGLTAAEVTLATQLLEGAALREVAERRGVSESTVRSQLKSLFRKTDTNRQASLVLKLLRGAPRVHRRAG